MVVTVAEEEVEEKFVETQTKNIRSPLLKSPFSVSRTVGSVATTATGTSAGKSYLPTFLTGLVGGGDRRWVVGGEAGKEKKSDCDYKLLEESERLLGGGAFDNEHCSSESDTSESEWETDEEGNFRRHRGSTGRNMKIFNLSSVSES